MYYLGTFGKVRGVYAVPLQYCYGEHVALASRAAFLGGLLLPLGQLWLVNLFSLSIVGSFFCQTFHKGIKLAHHAIEPKLLDPALIEVKLAIQEACSVVVLAEHAQLEQTHDVLQVNAGLLAQGKKFLCLLCLIQLLRVFLFLAAHPADGGIRLFKPCLKVGYHLVLFKGVLSQERVFGFQLTDMRKVGLPEFPQPVRLRIGRRKGFLKAGNVVVRLEILPLESLVFQCLYIRFFHVAKVLKIS